MKMLAHPFRRYLAVAAALALIAGCGGSSDSTQPDDSTPGQNETVPPADNSDSTGQAQTNGSVATWNGTIFPADNFWNTRIDGLPVHPRSQEWVNAVGADSYFHSDFGSGTWDGGPIGIPFNAAGAATPKYNVSFYYPDESDPGPYPIPDNARREWGSDHHILVVDADAGSLYEIYDAALNGDTWAAGSGAVWDLSSNNLRPGDWTSGDLAGLPILPGLVQYDQVASGRINHALRFCAFNTAEGYIWPARHPVPDLTGQDRDLTVPPMGARFRLKASYQIPADAPLEVQVILRAMKEYGIVLADHGSEWYVSGCPDERWNNENLHWLDENLQGGAFEAVDTSSMMIDRNSAACRK